MANEKEPTAQLKSLKNKSRLCFVGEFVSVFTPFIAIGIVNYDKYFIQYDGTRISLGFALAMAVMGLAIWLVGKKNITNSFITLFIGWGVAVGIVFLIQELLSDLFYIMLFGWLGLGGALGLDIGKTKLNQKAAKIQEAIEQAKKEQMVAAYKSESERKVKIKIKK